MTFDPYFHVNDDNYCYPDSNVENFIMLAYLRNGNLIIVFD